LRVPLHIVEARRSRLAELLQKHAYLPIQEVCRRLGVSVATARRDLSALAGQGRLVRTFGGALAEFDENFASFAERLRAAAAGKRRIGDEAASLVSPGSVVYLDGGTTILAVAESLASRRPANVTVFTNNLPVADRLGDCPGFNVVILGGTYFRKLAQLGGRPALRALEKVQFDLALMSAEAMRPEGIFNSHASITELQHAVLSRARQRAFCLDRTKIGSDAPALVVHWPDVRRLITDASRDELAELSAGAVAAHHHPGAGR
jgi:DeoR/GlpR family transcriptional regulator of sugar metabolism